MSRFSQVMPVINIDYTKIIVLHFTVAGNGIIGFE